jgi:recombination protein RecR
LALPVSLEKLIALLGRFPGVGEKSARRMALFLLLQPERWTRDLAEAMVTLRENLHPCSECGNLTDEDLCSICRDPLRDREILCVVETVEDLISLEQSGVHDGLFHVLGGRVSPLDGEDLPPEALNRLVRRLEAGTFKEVILATNPRVEGDLTYFAVLEALKDRSVRISRLAYGLPVGGSIGFADRVTLHAAMEARRQVKEGDGQ